MTYAAGGLERAKRYLARVAWLQSHPELLARLPSAMQDVGPDQADALDAAQHLMRRERLYAATTGPRDVRWGIRMLVSELRGEHIAKGQRFR